MKSKPQKSNSKQNDGSEEGVLNNMLHRISGKIQLINQECGLRNEEYDKIIAYMGQAIQSIEVLDITREMKSNSGSISANENSLLMDSNIQDLLFTKLTKRFETYMGEIQKKILTFEGYEKMIETSVTQISDMLSEVESVQIISQLLSINIEDNQEKSEEDKQRDHLYENVKKDLKKLAKIDQDYHEKLKIAREIKTDFTPFGSSDTNLAYWKKKIGLEV